MKRLLAAALAVGVLAAACGGSSSAPSNLPIPAAPSTTEIFTGTLPVGESRFHTFTAGQRGEVDITLTAVGPPPTIFVGLGAGVPNDTGCAVSITAGNTVTGSTQAGPAPQIVGNAAAAGQFCVVIADIGNLANPVDYSITVVHPQ